MLDTNDSSTCKHAGAQVVAYGLLFITFKTHFSISRLPERGMDFVIDGFACGFLIAEPLAQPG